MVHAGVSWCVCEPKTVGFLLRLQPQKMGVASKETHQHHLQSSSVKINEARQGWQKVDLARRLLGMNLDDSSCSFLQTSAFWAGKSPTGFAQDALSRTVEPLCGVSRARRGASHFRVLLSAIGGAPCTGLTVEISEGYHGGQLQKRAQLQAGRGRADRSPSR